MNHEVIVAMGSAFFIAPYTVVTAAHIVDGLWDELRSPHVRGRYPKHTVDRAFYALLGHIPDPDNPQTLARWQATSATKSAYTDIAFLNVVPVNETAERLNWPTFPEILLVPPEERAAVAALGYPDVTHQELSQGVVKFSMTSKLSTGIVTGAWANGRTSRYFPQFETNAEFTAGMSGGPVMHDGRICGIVSYGTNEESSVRHSYAAALWPLLLDGTATSVDPRTGIPFLSMLESGAVRAPGWRAISASVAATENHNGQRVAVLN
jgi:hypothetical protein